MDVIRTKDIKYSQSNEDRLIIPQAPTNKTLETSDMLEQLSQQARNADKAEAAEYHSDVLLYSPAIS